MTDFELYSLFNNLSDDIELLIERFITLLFAFLIASYLVGKKLDRLMTAIILSLYSAMVVRYAFIFFHVSNDVITLADELRTLAASPNSSMNTWLDIGPVHIFHPVVLAVMLLSYFASIVFFFRARTHQPSPRFEAQAIAEKARE